MSLCKTSYIQFISFSKHHSMSSSKSDFFAHCPAPLFFNYLIIDHSPLKLWILSLMFFFLFSSQTYVVIIHILNLNHFPISAAFKMPLLFCTSFLLSWHIILWSLSHRWRVYFLLWVPDLHISMATCHQPLKLSFPKTEFIFPCSHSDMLPHVLR